MNNNIVKIRYVKNEDKTFWFSLDKHLPPAEFDKKVRDKQGYVLNLGYSDCGTLLMPNQPTELFLIKKIK